MDVIADVEVRGVDPDGIVSQWNEGQPLPVARDQMQARGDVRANTRDGDARVPAREGTGLEDRRQGHVYGAIRNPRLSKCARSLAGQPWASIVRVANCHVSPPGRRGIEHRVASQMLAGLP